METYRNTVTPSRVAWERIQPTIPDGSKKPTAFSERDFYYQIFDVHGQVHVCQEFLNKWLRCRRANAASFDASLVCRKFHEDYIECTYAEKKNIRDKTAKQIWKKYEYAKAEATPEKQGGIKNKLTHFRPIYSD
mmetsp:Transcript_5476/g.9173  ORF Transcript_5476/g.9173 Transcript_5476/m.9173 type:complete len:134 (-) Transcript_5476:465-866(-)